jgi:hypothetical protein
MMELMSVPEFHPIRLTTYLRHRVVGPKISKVKITWEIALQHDIIEIDIY